MSYSTTIWEGIVEGTTPAGSNELNLKAKSDVYLIPSGSDDQLYLGHNFIGAELTITNSNAHPTYTIFSTTGLLTTLQMLKHFAVSEGVAEEITPGTPISIVFPTANMPSGEDGEISVSTSESYTPDAPDVTEEYSIDHGENTVKYSPLGGDVGITQKAVDDINAKESAAAETAIQNSYAEDAADAKLLNHARLRNQGQI